MFVCFVFGKDAVCVEIVLEKSLYGLISKKPYCISFYLILKVR